MSERGREYPFRMPDARNWVQTDINTLCFQKHELFERTG